MFNKSSTCYGRTGQPLNEYTCRGDAANHARYLRQEHNTEFVPYRCGVCGFWHLSPSERFTPSRECNICRDSQGRPKDLFLTREDASRRSQIIMQERGVYLEVYRCPAQPGWHLTGRRITSTGRSNRRRK